jgi:hypothetical protein
MVDWTIEEDQALGIILFALFFNGIEFENDILDESLAMPRPYANPRQIHAILVKCRAQLSHIMRQSTVGSPNAKTVAHAHLGALGDVVVHVVVTLQGLGADAARARTQITRSYANGVDTHQRTTIACVESICAALDTMLATLDDEAHAVPENKHMG